MGGVVSIGLDLAWSRRNLTGGAVIVDGELVAACSDLTDDAHIVGWVGTWLGEGDAGVIAVDAPLCVPNQAGRRLCETLLGEEWHWAHARPYPSNRGLFAKFGVRGEDLVRKLHDAYQFVEAAPIEPTPSGRFVCEVYPHPAHVSLFDLPAILKYKRKTGRSYESCWAELERYQALLGTLQDGDPPLRDPNEILQAHFAGVKGKSLKAMEDRLDAITCAYIAAYLWRYGPAGAIVYGTLADGHIIVPRRLRDAHAQVSQG